MRKGFTLVEMLIVISIVGILATVAIGEYSRFRKTSVLDLTTDGVVSALNEARDQSKWGKVGGGEGADVSSAKCYGLEFSTDKGITRLTADFDVGKKWDGGKWVYNGCKTENVQTGMVLELNESLSVLSINEDPGLSCKVFYMPPNGDVFKDSLCKGTDGNLTLVLGYKDDTDTSYQRKVLVDLNIGAATVHKMDEAQPPNLTIDKNINLNESDAQ